jgi:SAM-dependent methyltransferase
MNRFELDSSLQEEIRACVLGDGFIKIVQSVRRNGSLFKISMRPVVIGGEKLFQAEMTDAGRVQVKNFAMSEAAEGLEEILSQKGARDLHLMSASGDIHVRVTRKGKIHVSRSKKMERDASVRPHDRVKKLPLTMFDSSAFLRIIGIADAEGKIRASMRGKYDQINEFLKMLPPLEEEASGRGDRAFTVVDCGCGKAYLTFALYFYLSGVVGFKNVKIIGVDRRSDVIESARKAAKALDVEDKVVFEECDLADYNAENIDMVVSLHACDTATDEALAKAVEWKVKYILSAPCCQHELQKHVSSLAGRHTGAGKEFAGLLRQSILRERMCDILTDSFRALIMRILGFRTQVVEFVSSEATARNIMLKCEYGAKPGQSGAVCEYLALREYWDVTPWLEDRLKEKLSRHLEKFQ